VAVDSSVSSTRVGDTLTCTWGGGSSAGSVRLTSTGEGSPVACEQAEIATPSSIKIKQIPNNWYFLIIVISDNNLGILAGRDYKTITQRLIVPKHLV
jgi:hypothetical protein